MNMIDVKDQFNNIFLKLLNGECDSPDQLSKYVLMLSAHLFNLDRARIEAERIFAKLWEARRQEFKTDKQADMILKNTEEWNALEEARASYRMCQQLVMSAKKRLTVLSDQSRGNY